MRSTLRRFQLNCEPIPDIAAKYCQKVVAREVKAKTRAKADHAATGLLPKNEAAAVETAKLSQP